MPKKGELQRNKSGPAAAARCDKNAVFYAGVWCVLVVFLVSAMCWFGSSKCMRSWVDVVCKVVRVEWPVFGPGANTSPAWISITCDIWCCERCHCQQDANQIVKIKKDCVSCVLPWACKWNYRPENFARVKHAEGKLSYRGSFVARILSSHDWTGVLCWYEMGCESGGSWMSTKCGTVQWPRARAYTWVAER